jgi:hypothetical protein
MDTLAELILERDKERGRRRSLALRPSLPAGRQGRVTQSQPKIGQPTYITMGKPAFRPSAALLLLGVPQRVRLRRRALHTAKIRASNVSIIC